MSVLYVCISIPALLLSSSVLFFKDKEVVAQLCPTLCDPLDCNPPGSSVHGIFQARILEWVAIFLLQGLFLIKGLNPCLICLLHWRQILYRLSHWGSPAWPRWGGRWGESSRGKGHMYTYGGFTFMYGRKQHNIIIILELKINNKKLTKNWSIICYSETIPLLDTYPTKMYTYITKTHSQKCS